MTTGRTCSSEDGEPWLWAWAWAWALGAQWGSAAAR
jgi:hypothetical protein